MKTLSASQVNEILEEFEGAAPDFLRKGQTGYSVNSKYELVSATVVSPFTESQGENGQEEFVFKIDEELYLKVICYSDSYGEYTHNIIRFVSPQTKTINVYEPV